MIEDLERFVVDLRRRGLPVSPAEWLDAVRALEQLGLGSRDRVRAALRSTLVKTHREQPAFDQAFDAFFAVPTGKRARHRRKGDRSIFRKGGDGSVVRRADLSPPFRKIDLSPGRLRRVIRASEVSDRRPADTAARRPERGHRTLGFCDQREMARLVSRQIERIRLGSGRRQRRSPQGRPYLRRLFRELPAQGGVPFVLPRRQLRPKRSNVVLLVDVSWSTATAAGLFLSIACEFLRRPGEVRVLLFVDRVVDATAEIEAWLRGSRRGSSFARLIADLRGLNLDAPSDYGRAFHHLLRSALRPRGRNTLLLVLGDGRTNRFDPQEWALDELASACGATLWLVPEPFVLWGTGDSALDRYLPLVETAIEADDLNGLARGVTELLRRL